MSKLSYIIILIILIIVLSSGLAISVFAQSIEAALTVPTRLRSMPPVTQTTLPPMGTPHAPGGTPHVGTTPVVMNTVLAQDTFQRADQLFWSTASDGQAWGADAATQKVFSIVGQVGQVANGQGYFSATLGPVVADAEVQFSGSISQFHLSNLGAVLRWMNPNNWYKAYIDGTNLIIVKKLASIGTRLGAVPFKASAGVVYTLRFRVIGTALSTKVWPADQAEPPNWMVTVTDTSFQNGYGGLRILIDNGTVAKITAFQETTVMSTS